MELTCTVQDKNRKDGLNNEIINKFIKCEIIYDPKRFHKSIYKLQRGEKWEMGKDALVLDSL